MASRIETKRAQRREELFSDSASFVFNTKKENGWTSIPRILPLVLRTLASKEVSGTANPGLVYVDLLMRDMGSGMVELRGEREHVFFAGYTGRRAIRTWESALKILEEAGFILRRTQGGKTYVLLIHPMNALFHLRKNGRVDDDLWEAIEARQKEVDGPWWGDPLQPDHPNDEANEANTETTH